MSEFGDSGSIDQAHRLRMVVRSPSGNLTLTKGCPKQTQHTTMFDLECLRMERTDGSCQCGGQVSDGEVDVGDLLCTTVEVDSMDCRGMVGSVVVDIVNYEMSVDNVVEGKMSSNENMDKLNCS